VLQQAGSQGGQQVAEYVRRLVQGLREDRQGLFMGSILRSLLFITAAAIAGWLSLKGKIRPLATIGIIGALAFIDLIGVDLDYLNNDRYQDEEEAQNSFSPTAADTQILQDKGYYRVFDLREGVENITNSATASYFHHSITGYHPAKLSIYQDLIEHQLYKFPNCLPVLDMLNTKYILQPSRTGRDSVVVNPGALGAAWFVLEGKAVETPSAMMDSLTNLDPREAAVLFGTDKKKIWEEMMTKNQQPGSESQADSMEAALKNDSIQLVKNDNDEMEYQSVSGSMRFAVFSEVYYDRGWKACIDGTETPIYRTDYVLRGLLLPAGRHRIRFVFHPASFYTGQLLQGIASVVLLLLFAGAIGVEWRGRKMDKRTPGTGKTT
jgi:hypothetical protein